VRFPTAVLGLPFPGLSPNFCPCLIGAQASSSLGVFHSAFNSNAGLTWWSL